VSQDLPAIPDAPHLRATGPLAQGFTVNLTENPDQSYRLRVWLQGKPIVDEPHPTPSAAAMRVGALILSGMVGAKLKEAAMAAMGGGGFT
jgi:hypothetical protein